MSDVTIFHNPSCGTSRSVLEILRSEGHEPTIIEYLKTPPDRETLGRIADAVGGARALLRSKEKLCAELGLDDASVPDEKLLDAMARHPVLMNRPVVVTSRGTRLCRPAEMVRELL